jgi:hypothetical protein
VSALVVGNAIFFLASLNNYLNANEQGNHLIDTQMVWDHAMTTLWWQIIANGALLLAVPRTRRTRDRPSGWGRPALRPLHVADVLDRRPTGLDPTPRTH